MQTGGDASMYVIRELQKELERQAELIYQLREDNVSLRSKLENERAVRVMYAEQLRQVQDGVPIQQTTESISTEKPSIVSTSPAESEFPLLNNGTGLTIRTQLQTSASEGSWLDDTDSMTGSEYEEQKRSSLESGPAHKLTWKHKRLMFFRGAKNKDRKRTSLRQFLSKSQRSDATQTSEEVAETTTLALTADNSQSHSQISHRVESLGDEEPAARHQQGQDKGSPSQMDWTNTEIGQEIKKIKESYSQNKDVFEDDVRFIYEVLNGESKAPEMDEEVELHNLMKDFKRWKKQFEASLKKLHATLKKRSHTPTFPTAIIYKLATDKACARQKRQRRTSTSDLHCQQRSLSASQ